MSANEDEPHHSHNITEAELRERLRIFYEEQRYAREKKARGGK